MARRNSKNLEHFAEEAGALEKVRASEDVERDNELLELRALLTDPRTRKFLWRLMEKTQMFSDPMNANFGTVGHSLGRAAVGKWVMGEIVEADYTAWLVMQQEHYQRQLEREALAEAARTQAEDSAPD